MEINIGEYVRTNDGYIGKLLEIRESKRECDTYYKTDKTMASGFYEHIKAHSKNIIDLIEVGDYVNGTKVTNIDNYDDIYTIEWEYGNVYTTEIINDKFIKTILTHEIYEREAYKIE